MSEQEIYSKALETFGNLSQSNMLIEEMAELTQAILKDRRNGSSASDNFHEEFADVRIVMAQIELCLKPERLAYWKEFKLNRLSDRIKNHG